MTERSRERGAAWIYGIRFNIALSAAAKLTTLLLNLLLLRQILGFLGSQSTTGLWLALASIAMGIALFDFGIGNGLRNALAKRLALQDTQGAARTVSSAYLLICFAVLPSVILLSSAAMFVDWDGLLNSGSTGVTVETIRVTVVILTLGLGIYLVLSLVTAVLNGARLTGFAGGVSSASNLLLVIVVSMVHVEDPNTGMWMLALFQIGSMLLPNIVASMLVFGRLRPDLRPRLALATRELIGELARSSGQFLVIQAGLLVILGLNEPVIAALHTTDDVVAFQALNRMFTIFTIAFSVTLSPVWAKMTHDFHSGRHAEVWKLYSRMRSIMLAFALAAVAFNPVILWAISWLYHLRIADAPLVLASMTTQTCAVLWLYFSTSLANALGRLWPQTLTLGIGALVKIPAAALFPRIDDRWITVIWVNCVILIATCLAQWRANHALRVSSWSSPRDPETMDMEHDGQMRQ